MNKSEAFLKDHKIHPSTINLQHIVDAFFGEMKKGLEGKESSLEMIPTYIEAESEFKDGDKVLAIDAGGTNFRAAIVSFGSNNQVEIGEIIHKRMPGVNQEISAETFFKTIAGYIEDLAKKVEKIGFCFSYAVEIFPNKDGRLIKFSKEVQAPEVIGKMIGKSLLETLGNPSKKIVLLNDTVATLLAGKSARVEKSYDSFIGFILGTGTNTSYIEKNRNILKKGGLDPNKSQIINMETGNFAKAPLTDLDLKFDNTTNNPSEYTFEKMFSGGYFGGLCLTVLQSAAEENLFSSEAAACINKVDSLTAEEANDFLMGRNSEGNILMNCFKRESDREASSQIIDALIERASLMAAANLAAVVLKTGKGTEPEKPILITIEGTTFYKLHKLQERFENYLSDYLSGDKKRYVEFANIDYSSLKGAALAAQLN